MDRKFILPLFLVLACIVSACARQQADRPVVIPKDFKVVAIAGGIAPGTNATKVEIDSAGNAVYYEMPAKNRARGVFIEKKKFKLEDPALRHIYKMVKKNDFFSLKESYVSEQVLDGSFAKLTVTMNGKTHTVRTQNIAVSRFDNIMIAVNMATPGMRMVLYNEILC